MKKKNVFLILTFGLIINTFAQNTLELNFTAIDDTSFVQLDSIKVINRTQEKDTVLYYPDTILILDYQVAVEENRRDASVFRIFQNYPNPVIDRTTISFYIPEKDLVNLIVTDIFGQVILKTRQILNQGYHSYQFRPGYGNLFILTCQWRDKSSSIKIVKACTNTNNNNTFEYIKSELSSHKLKVIERNQQFQFDLGDKLLYICYNDTLQSGLIDSPVESQSYTFQFASNIPCPGIPTIEYEGQVYNTVQILSQCWMKENLNVGTMISGSEQMSNNGIIEKYCYNNETDSCNKYGGIYQWNEMMSYTNQPESQGICPQGWHIPSDDEWKILSGVTDSQYFIGDTIWNEWFYSGYDAALNLKKNTEWYLGGNGTNYYGFSALPGGAYFDTTIQFYNIGVYILFWTSTELSQYGSGILRGLYSSEDMIFRDFNGKMTGNYVRCIKDN